MDERRNLVLAVFLAILNILLHHINTRSYDGIGGIALLYLIAYIRRGRCLTIICAYVDPFKGD